MFLGGFLILASHLAWEITAARQRSDVIQLTGSEDTSNASFIHIFVSEWDDATQINGKPFTIRFNRENWH